MNRQRDLHAQGVFGFLEEAIGSRRAYIHHDHFRFADVCIAVAPSARDFSRTMK
ncbi:hypothetical protein HX794_24875 [Pseudomonas costantinii]|uniref:hypothetical protein n=1 Tax=Pseudomonas costantinii TaxID=168469 RepID=UPI0015A09EB9|nr:hypothetical protein [Pseudomonas costantinii]NVZ22883.1 hypothetical protein [Pseudomonas costantinii]